MYKVISISKMARRMNLVPLRVVYEVTLPHASFVVVVIYFFIRGKVYTLKPHYDFDYFLQEHANEYHDDSLMSTFIESLQS